MGKKSSKTTSSTVYGNTTTTNPYVTSKTDNKGTVSTFNSGSAFDVINNFVNNNMDELLEQYLNPTLNSVTNRAKMNAFTDALSANSFIAANAWSSVCASFVDSIISVELSKNSNKSLYCSASNKCLFPLIVSNMLLIEFMLSETVLKLGS